MLIIVILSVFIAGLMVGRTPEYLGKKVEAREVKAAMLYVLIFPLLILGFSAWASVAGYGTSSLNNAGRSNNSGCGDNLDSAEARGFHGITGGGIAVDASEGIDAVHHDVACDNSYGPGCGRSSTFGGRGAACSTVTVVSNISTVHSHSDVVVGP